jgi:hypothetical protein
MESQDQPVKKESAAKRVIQEIEDRRANQVKKVIKENAGFPETKAWKDEPATRVTLENEAILARRANLARRATKVTRESAGRLAYMAIKVPSAQKDRGVTRVILVPMAYLESPVRREIEAMSARKVKKAIKAKKVTEAKWAKQERKAREGRGVIEARKVMRAGSAKMGRRGS